MRPRNDDLSDLYERLRRLRIEAAQVRARSRELREAAAAARGAGAPPSERADGLPAYESGAAGMRWT